MSTSRNRQSAWMCQALPHLTSIPLAFILLMLIPHASTTTITSPRFALLNVPGSDNIYEDALRGAPKLFVDNRQGHLATLATSEEFFHVVNTMGVRNAWIAANDYFSQGTFRWTEGPEFGMSVVAPGNSDFWTTGEPNNSGDCLIISTSGKFADVSCGSNIAMMLVEYEDQTWSTALVNTPSREPHLFGGHYYNITTTRLNFTDAALAAAKLSYRGMVGHLVTITSKAEQDFVVSLLGASTAWIGISDNVTEGSYRFIGGPETDMVIAYTAWTSGAPNNYAGIQDCVQTAASGWNDWECFDLLLSVVEYDCPAVTVPGAYGCSLPMFGGRFYAIMSGAINFNAALSLAAASTYRGMTGFLATVESEEEYRFFHWGLKARMAWISASDIQNQTTFRYMSGVNITKQLAYRPWMLEQPNGGTSQDCVYMDEFGINDFQCATSHMDYIVEYECLSPRIIFQGACILPTCDNYFEGGGWALVRRVKQGLNWHPATDNLAGTDVYGSHPYDPETDTFSLPFANLVSQTTNMLFRSGDQSRFLITTFGEINNAGLAYTNASVRVNSSSVNTLPYSTTWSNRPPQIYLGGSSALTPIYMERSSTAFPGSINTLGGMNVYIHSTTLCPFVHFCDNTFLGGSWVLVRRVKQGKSWHPANDSLNGTSVYGGYGSPTSDSSFSIAFSTYLTASTEMLFMTGDRSLWLATTRGDIFNSGTAVGDSNPRSIMASSSNPSTHSRKWRNNNSPVDAAEPWISLNDYPSGVLYGEAAFADQVVLRERLDSLKRGGVNVYVRNYQMCPLICVNEFEKGGWALVRRVAKGTLWYQANDNLQGTASYGISAAKPTDTSSYSIPYAAWVNPNTKFLLATGDMSKWVIASYASITGGGIPYYSPYVSHVVDKSSASSISYSTSAWVLGASASQHPNIYLGSNTAEMIYSEASSTINATLIADVSNNGGKVFIQNYAVCTSCTDGCMHGVCVPDVDYCLCYPGWGGTDCNAPVCHPDCDPTGGYCDLPGECKCGLGYSGTNCEIEGLSLNVTISSSLVTEKSYQNASVYFSLANNTGFISYRISVAQFSSGLNAFGNDLSGWSKASFTSNISSKIVITNLAPGKLLRLSVWPTDTTNKESIIAYINKAVRTTCGCPVNTKLLLTTEPTGLPQDVTLRQFRGKVYLSWTDTSLCESGFGFDRSGLTFTPDYLVRGSSVCFAKHAPTSVYDDLVAVASSVSVGSEQTYCIRALNEQGYDYGYQSASACQSIVIAWEASVSGYVRSAATAGGLPTKGAIIEWNLVEYPETKGKVTTDDEGYFNIDIQQNGISGDQAVLLKISKTLGTDTSAITFAFECNGVPCTNRTVTASHLTFANTALFTDVTTVSFQGTVSIADTSSFNLPSSNPCPLRGALVCAHNHYGVNEKIACTSTDSNGMYAVPVPRGLNVELIISYNGHTFKRIEYSDREPAGVDLGFVGPDEDPSLDHEFFNAKMPIDRIDYEDISTIDVTIELAGGLCNRSLGAAEVWFSRTPECGLNFKLIKELPSFSTTITLPAHRFDFVFGALKTNLPTFNLAVGDYLIRAGNNSGELELTNFTDGSTITRARFEYHPLPSIEVSLSNTDQFTCTNGQTPSFLKIESLFKSNATMKLLESYPLTLEPPVPACSFVQGTINVTNNLGEDSSSVPLLSVCRETCPLEIVNDAIVKSTVVSVCATNIEDGNKAILSCPSDGVITDVVFAEYGNISSGSCSTGFTNTGCKAPQAVAIVRRACLGLSNCSFAVQNSLFSGTCASNVTGYLTVKLQCTVYSTEYKNAKVLLPIQAGYPNRISPYYKTLVSRMQVLGYIDDIVITTNVLITGLKWISDSFSVPFPQYMPLMVLHDPAGGLSTSSYQNQYASTDISIKTTTDEGAVLFHVEAGWAFKFGSTFCAGLGAAVCTSVAEAEGHVQALGEVKKSWITSEINTSTATLTFDYSYTTSDDQLLAGNKSDMFLTPALNVKFSISALIGFDETTCSATSKDIVTWSLDSDSNVPVFTWRSVSDIQDVVLPFLETILDIEQTIVSTSTNITAKAESVKKIAQLTSSVDGWQSLLDRNTKLYNDARAGKLKKNAITQLVADALLQDSNGNDNIKFINGSQAPDSNKLRSISAISFGGAGGLLTYTDTSDQINEVEKSKGTLVEHEAGVNSEARLLFSAGGFAYSASLTNVGSAERSKANSKGTQSLTSRSFTLGDADHGDYFDVQIFEDPVYGSFLFNTMSGQSRCAVEDYTVKRDAVNLRFFTGDGVVKNVVPNAPAVFEIVLENTSESGEAGDYVLGLLKETNPEGLRVLVGGQPLSGEILFASLPFGGTKTVVEVYRTGLRNYDFTDMPLTLYMASACQSDVIQTIKLKPVYSKMCATVEFHGNLKTFDITSSSSSTSMLIQAFKPDNYLTTYTEFNATAGGLKIELLYRKKGSIVWNKAYNSTGKPTVLLDIKPNTPVSSDVASGYLFGEWNVANFNSATYELTLHAICSTLGNAYPGIDDSYSKIVEGTIKLIDTHLVVASTYPEHLASAHANEEFSATFNQPVNCDKENGRFWFDVKVMHNSTEVPSTNYAVFCEDTTIYIQPVSNGAQFNYKYLNVSIIQRNNPSNVWFWRFYVKPALVDKSPPKEYSQHAQPAVSYLPGDDISMAFDEPIDCTALYVFAMISGGDSLVQSDFLITCQGNSVFLDFAPNMSIPFENLIGRKIHIIFNNVSDIHGNFVLYPVVWGFTIGDYGVNEASVFVSGAILSASYASFITQANGAGDVQTQLAAYFGIAATRITSVTILESYVKTVAFTFLILPPTSSSDTKTAPSLGSKFAADVSKITSSAPFSTYSILSALRASTIRVTLSSPIIRAKSSNAQSSASITAASSSDATKTTSESTSSENSNITAYAVVIIVILLVQFIVVLILFKRNATKLSSIQNQLDPAHGSGQAVLRGSRNSRGSTV